MRTEFLSSVAHPTIIPSSGFPYHPAYKLFILTTVHLDQYVHQDAFKNSNYVVLLLLIVVITIYSLDLAHATLVANCCE